MAGNGTAGFTGDGGPATTAELNLPGGVSADSSGNLFIADTNNQRIREVVAATKNIVTVAGNGTFGFMGDGGLAPSAELNNPAGLFVDSSGNIFIADTSNERIREVMASTGDIQTIAGNGSTTFSGNGISATNAALSVPSGVFADSFGNFFIADNTNDRIREVDSTGNIKTVAGGGPTGGTIGDGGPATSALLGRPNGVFVPGSGNIFIADSGFQRIREVVVSTGIIQTVAGNGTFGFMGDGGPATSAELANPFGVAVDSSGNIFISDSGNQRIREVVAATKNIVTVAGNGTFGFMGDGGLATSAELADPFGVAVDNSGNIFIADNFNNRVREVVASTGVIQTVVGNGMAGSSGDGGPATSAQLNGPFGVAVDCSGNIFIATKSDSRIRKVVASTGTIQTVAGNGNSGFSGDGGPATSAELGAPEGVSVDGPGNIFIADSGNNRIRRVGAGAPAATLSPSSLNFGNQIVNTTS